MHAKPVRVCVLVLMMLSAACQRHKLPLPPEREQALPQWPVWGGNLRHTANAADSVEFYVGPQLGREVWARKLSGDVGGAPSIHSDGTIYVGSGPANLYADSGFVYAFLPDGTVKWRFKTEGPVMMSGALGQDGTYYVGDYLGNVYAVDARGSLRWKARTSGYSGGHPAITRSGAVVFPSDRFLSAFDASTGELLWQLPAEIRANRGVSISAEGRIYVGTHESLLAIAEDGSVLWEVPLSLGPSEVLIGRKGTLYFQIERDNFVYAISPDGTLRWKFDMGTSAQNNNPALSIDERIYAIKAVTPQELVILSAEGVELRRLNLVALSGATGGVAVTNTTPIVDRGGTVYLTFLPEGGLPNWYAIQRTGALKWKILIAPENPFFFDKPAMAPDGTLYISSDYDLHAVR